MTLFSKHLGGHGPFGPPWLRLCLELILQVQMVAVRDEVNFPQKRLMLFCFRKASY